jgi:uncharacterized membrane protein YecN with MAPEG domain
MEMNTVKKWLVFFCGILTAILVADRISGIIVAASGIAGWPRFLVSFILYAVLFFAILYAIGRVLGISFFGLNQDEQDR